MDGNISNIKELFEIIKTFTKDEDIVNFVKNRLNVLEKNSRERTIDKINDGKLIGTITEGYITANSPITTSLMVDPFYMNDINLYVNFIKYIKDKDTKNLINLFSDMGNFIKNTFGFKGNQVKREYVYLQDRENEISIADFYNNNSALCSERSAAVQNLMEFCCINSYLVFGKIEVEGNIAEHAYNIIKAKTGNLILLDITNPVALIDNGKICYAPAFSDIGIENIENIEEINFDLEALSQIYNLPLHDQERSRPRIYRTCNYELNRLLDSNKKM